MSKLTPDEIRAVYARSERLYSKEEVDAAYDRMAEDITRRLEHSNPLVVCVMLGGLIPAGQLIPRLDFLLELDYLHATRYRGKTRGGELHWLIHPSHTLKDRVVLLIDDILDEGYTLAAIAEACAQAGAREVDTAVLLDKVVARKNGFTATFTGLHVEDRYLFGCGMDYKGYLRNVPGVYAVPKEME